MAFKREVAPKLDAFWLKEIAAATGLSLAACSRIRSGSKVPHPRHWGGLAALVANQRPHLPVPLLRRDGLSIRTYGMMPTRGKIGVAAN